MTLMGIVVLFVKSLLSMLGFAMVAMAAHFQGTVREPEPTEIALQVQRNLQLEARRLL